MRLGMELMTCGFGKWYTTLQLKVAIQMSFSTKRRRSIRSTTWSFCRSRPLLRLTQLEQGHMAASTETDHVRWFGYNDMAEISFAKLDGTDHRRRCRASTPMVTCIFKHIFWTPTTQKIINNAMQRGLLMRRPRTPARMMKKMFPEPNVRLWSVSCPGEPFQRQTSPPLWRPFRVSGMNGASGVLAKQLQVPRYPRSWFFHLEFATGGNQLPTLGVTKRRRELLSKASEIHTYLCWPEMHQFFLEMGWWLSCSGVRAMVRHSTMQTPSRHSFKDYLMTSDQRRSTWDRPRTRSHCLEFLIGTWTSFMSWSLQFMVQPTHPDDGTDASEEWSSLWSGRSIVWILVFFYGWQLGRTRTVKMLRRWWLCLVSTWMTSWWQLYRIGRRRLWTHSERLSSGVELGRKTILSSRVGRSQSFPTVATCWTNSTMSRRFRRQRARRRQCLWKEILPWCQSSGPVLDLCSGLPGLLVRTLRLMFLFCKRVWKIWQAMTSTRSTRSSSMWRRQQTRAFASGQWILWTWSWLPMVTQGLEMPPTTNHKEDLWLWPQLQMLWGRLLRAQCLSGSPTDIKGCYGQLWQLKQRLWIGRRMQPTTSGACWLRRWIPTLLRLAQGDHRFQSTRWRMQGPCLMRSTASLRPSWSGELRSMWRLCVRTAGISSGFQVRLWSPIASRRDPHSSEMPLDDGWATLKFRCSSPKMPVLGAPMTSGVRSKVNSQQKIWPV